MNRTPFRIGQALVATAAAAFLLTVIVTGGGDPHPQPASAGIDLAPSRPTGPTGLAHLERGRTRLTGTVVVWNLAPRSRHYAALRGPQARCTGRPAQVAAALPALTADARGVAVAKVDLAVLSETFEDGLGLTVHAGTAPGSPVLACGTTARP